MSTLSMATEAIAAVEALLAEVWQQLLPGEVLLFLLGACMGECMTVTHAHSTASQETQGLAFWVLVYSRDTATVS